MIELVNTIKYMHDLNFDKKRIENFLLAQSEMKNKEITLKSMPYRYIIEPSNKCNLHCPLCPTSIKSKDKQYFDLSLEDFKKIIDQIKEYALEIYLQNWGEPTLNKNLPEMISYASKANIFTYVSTNFNLKYTDEYLEKLLKSGLSLLYIDVDGTNQESYAKYRVGGDFERLVKNIKKIVELKKKFSLKYPIIRTHFMVMKHNEQYIEEYKELAKTLEVDEYTVGNIQINPQTTYEWLPDNKDYVYESYYNEIEKPTTCNWLYAGMVINSDGGVSPCCITFDKKDYFDNIYQHSIESIRNNDYYTSARASFANKVQKETTICAECLGMVGSKNLTRVGNTFAIKSK